jgi:predicted peroxiredoxin
MTADAIQAKGMGAHARQETSPDQSVCREISRFRRRVWCFILTPCLLLVPWLPIGVIYGQFFLERAKGPTSETQINNSFHGAETREYDLLMLGNSRIYRGLNPDRFSIPSYNFGCNDDTFNQLYFKLKWLRERNVSFRYLVMGVDLFQFSYMSDYRNEVYTRYFGEPYLADYESHPWKDRGMQLRAFIRSLNPKYMFTPNNGRIFQRDNGQYIKPGRAKPTDTARRTTKRLPANVEYFENILADCQEHGVKVFLCMPPTRPEERNCYQEGEIEDFMQFIRQYVTEDVVLIDYTFDEGYAMSDFTDITHLNEAAAERFSVQLNESLMNYLTPIHDQTRIAVDTKQSSSAN